MMENDEYRTIQSMSTGLYKEKGSKFIAIAVPVESLEDVRINLEKLRKEYHDARHHCYAYRIGEEPYEFRYNDDGEPSGTAGKPIYGQIQSFELTNILIVVVRYFGGIKLGTGGLIQAYRASSKDALENSTIATKIWTNRLQITFNYLRMNDVMRIIKEDNLRVISQENNENCCMLLEIRKSNFENAKNKFLSLEMIDLTVI